MKKADIQNGAIANVIEVDPDNVPDWAADWPTVTNEGPGWLYDGSTFSEPVPTAEEVAIELAQARAAAIAEVVAETERKRLQVIHDAVAVDFKDVKNVKDVAGKLALIKAANTKAESLKK